MAEYYEYITGQGVIVPDTSVVLAEIQNEGGVWRGLGRKCFDPAGPFNRDVPAQSDVLHTDMCAG